jgi:hypothetical protein
MLLEFPEVPLRPFHFQISGTDSLLLDFALGLGALGKHLRQPQLLLSNAAGCLHRCRIRRVDTLLRLKHVAERSQVEVDTGGTSTGCCKCRPPAPLYCLCRTRSCRIFELSPHKSRVGV